MNRTEARTLAKTTLEGLGLFAHVYLAEPETFGGATPVAVLHSKSLAVALDTRDDTVLPSEFYLTIYIARPRDGDRDAVEAALDALGRAAVLAIWEAFGDIRDLDIRPSETGYPMRTFDNVPHRMERWAIGFTDEE